MYTILQSQPKSFKGLTCSQAVFSRDSDRPSSLFSFPLFYFNSCVAFPMSSECWNSLWRICPDNPGTQQWSWRKIKVSKLATSLLMFHLTQRCMGSDRSNSLAGRLEALEKCDLAIHEAYEVSGLQVWVTQTSYFSSLSFGMQILTPGAMNCTQVRWLSKGKTLQRLVVLLQGNPCCLCFPFPDLSIFNGLL